MFVLYITLYYSLYCELLIIILMITCGMLYLIIIPHFFIEINDEDSSMALNSLFNITKKIVTALVDSLRMKLY